MVWPSGDHAGRWSLTPPLTICVKTTPLGVVWTSRSTDALLLNATGSVSTAAVTDAVFVIVCPAVPGSTVTVRSSDAAELAVRLPTVHTPVPLL